MNQALVKSMLLAGIAGGAAALVARRVITGGTRRVLSTSVGSGQRFELTRQVWPLVWKYLNSLEDESIPVVRFRTPDELRAEFAKTGVALPFGAEETPADQAQLVDACQAILDFSVRSGNPLFNNQLYGAADPVGILGEIIGAAVNSNSHTFEVAPVATLMETHVLAKVAMTLGGAYAESHDGLFIQGGSLANAYALQLARYSYEPRIKEEGHAAAPNLVGFTSDQAHYSYAKSCNFLGLGTKNMIKVETDPRTGAMEPEALRAAIRKALAEGKQPFFVGATAGTTVLGAFDPFHELADIVDEFNKGAKSGPGRIWLHVDGAWGGSALFSKNTRGVMTGAERADSFCWNPHKAMGTPLQCTTLVTRHSGVFAEANGAKASYLFQPDKENTEYDQGDKTVQCGRKTDGIKIWLQWKALGDQGLERRMDHLMELSRYMSDRVGSMRDDQGRRYFVHVATPSFTNLCFYFIPPSLRTTAKHPLEGMDLEALSKVAPKVKSRMQRHGKAMIGFQPILGYPNCWRMVFAGAKEDIMDHEAVDRILESMIELGEDL